MAFIKSTERKELVLKFDNGVVDGKQKFKSKAYSIKSTSSDEAVYMTGTVISSLMDLVLEGTYTRNLDVIVEN